MCVCACLSVMNAEQVDVLLQRSEGGVDSALSYAKSIARYLKDVISYVDKRITHGKWAGTGNSGAWVTVPFRSMSAF